MSSVFGSCYHVSFSKQELIAYGERLEDVLHHALGVDGYLILSCSIILEVRAHKMCPLPSM